MLKSWSKLEKTLLITSIGIVTVLSVIFKSNVLTTVCSIVGIITALLLAKGKNEGQIFGILITILYSIVSFKNKFYGEVLIYIVLMLPMYILGIISWANHKNEKTNSVDVNKINKLELLMIFLLAIIIYVGVYFLLKAFNTNELYVSSFSVVTSLFAAYLQVRRSKHTFLCYAFNDIVLITLWGLPVIEGDLMLLPMLCNPCINLINDCYGIYNWRKLEKMQKS